MSPLRRISLLLLLAALASDRAPGEPPPEEVVHGTLQVAVGDPPPGSGGAARWRYWLREHDGAVWELRLPADVSPEVGRGLGLNGAEVSVVGVLHRAGAGSITASSVSLAGGSSSIPVNAAPVTGSVPWVVILCRFADSPTVMPHAASWYEELMGLGPGGPSFPDLDDYWRDASYDQLDLAGSRVVGWYDLPRPRSYYVTGSGAGEADLTELARDCSAVADPDVYFPSFSGVLFQFNENLDCCSWGGSFSLDLDGMTRSYRAGWMAPWSRLYIYAHEMGHGFGLPHSSGPYGSVYDSEWDVMSRGGTDRQWDEEFGKVPVQTIAIYKEWLGWVTGASTVAPGSSDTILLGSLSTSSSPILLIEAPIAGTDDSYSVELREVAGYDGNVPTSGVIVHRVSRACPTCYPAATVMDVDGDGHVNDFGAILTEGESFCGEGVQVTFVAEQQPGTATIHVENPVQRVNCAPRPLADHYATGEGLQLLVPAPGVLENDIETDAGDPSTLSLVRPPRHGSLVLEADGAFSYQPDPEFIGTDSFLYRVGDGSAEGTATVYLHVNTIGFETATGEPEPGGGWGVWDGFFKGVKFTLSEETRITSLGGALYGHDGPLFAAVAPLDPMTDLPTDPELADSVFVERFFPQTYVQTLAEGVRDTLFYPEDRIPPGRYAIIFGTGLFDALGRGAMPYNGLVVEDGLPIISGSGGSWIEEPYTVRFLMTGYRYFDLLLELAGPGSGEVRSSPAGVDCPGDCLETYLERSRLGLGATPDYGSEFAGWSGSTGCGDVAMLMDEDKTCEATFALCATDSIVTLPPTEVLGVELFEACNELRASAGFVVRAGAAATLRAANLVVLGNGLVTESGAALAVVTGPPPG